MAQPSLIDFLAPFDPTAYTTITGSQLYQLVAGATPFTDKGFVVVTTDIAGVAQIPDAASNPKWQQYIWLRRTAISVEAYVWNTVTSAWVSINIAAIGTGSIIGNMIATNTITFDKIVSLTWSQITGAPTFLSATSVASGDVTGIFSALTLGIGTVTTAKILDLNVTNSKLEAGSTTTGVDVTKLKSSSVAGSVLQDTGTTGVWAVPGKIYNLANPASAGDVNKLVTVKSPYTDGFQLSTVAAMLATISFNSAQVAIPAAAGAITPIAHGLGAIPAYIHVKIIPQGSDAATGYAIADGEIDASGATSSSGTFWFYPFIVWADATNIYLRRNGYAGLQLIHKTTGAATPVTAESNFKLKFNAHL